MAREFERLTALVAQLFGVSESQITINTNLDSDLGADSLDKLELANELEHEFCLSIPDEVAKSMRTIGEALRLVSQPDRVFQ
jgi:acyl carrier protein